MICDHPACTGKHKTNIPRTEMCPAALERLRTRENRPRTRSAAYTERKRIKNRERYRNDAEHRERSKAYTIARMHGMSLDEYRNYLARGCWICGDTATVIDHDHNIGCPPMRHSCDKCRRGPACQFCNHVMREGETAESIMDRADRLYSRAERLRQIAKALSNGRAKQDCGP